MFPGCKCPGNALEMPWKGGHSTAYPAHFQSISAQEMRGKDGLSRAFPALKSRYDVRCTITFSVLVPPPRGIACLRATRQVKIGLREHTCTLVPWGPIFDFRSMIYEAIDSYGQASTYAKNNLIHAPLSKACSQGSHQSICSRHIEKTDLTSATRRLRARSLSRV